MSIFKSASEAKERSNRRRLTPDQFKNKVSQSIDGAVSSGKRKVIVEITPAKYAFETELVLQVLDELRGLGYICEQFWDNVTISW